MARMLFSPEAIAYLREASNVRRCHGLPHHGDYTDGKHSFDAMTALLCLYPGEPSRELLLAVMFHDMAERWVGDSPSPALARFPDLGIAYLAAENHVFQRLLLGNPLDTLTPEERRWLKFIDRLELWLWCHDQIALGNRNAEEWEGGLKELLLSGEAPVEIEHFVKNFVWRRTRNKDITG